jgi:hypothetical protein
MEPTADDGSKELEFGNAPLTVAARDAETVEQSGTTGGSNF